MYNLKILHIRFCTIKYRFDFVKLLSIVHFRANATKKHVKHLKEIIRAYC